MVALLVIYSVCMCERGEYRIQPEDVLTEQEFETFVRGKLGELPCPTCADPLDASFYFFRTPEGEQHKGVVLWCDGCEFMER